MLVKAIAGSIVTTLLLAGPALAQNSSSKANAAQNNSQESQSQGSQNLPQRIRQKLQQQGFSEVKVVPGSFLVSAKDKDGDPVNMVIGPHSTTMLTILSSDGSSSQNSKASDKGATSGQR